jgi:cytoskeletal protein CcmA (bactofilin family)
MFARSKRSGDTTSDDEPGSRAYAPAPAPRAPAPPVPAPRGGLQEPAIKPSIISDAVTFVGELSSKGALHIDGSATGTIEAESITVGPSGRLEGNVRCGTLHVKGRFSGTAVCDELIIAEAAWVEGSMTYRTILAQRGARVLGDFAVAGADVGV